MRLPHRQVGKLRLAGKLRAGLTGHDPAQVASHRSRSWPYLNPVWWLATSETFSGPIPATDPIPGVRNYQAEAAAADLEGVFAQDEPAEERVLRSFGNAGHRW
jgi:hypothetical protein